MTVVGILAAPDPMILPTRLTAIFTGVLAVSTIVTAAFAALAFRKQAGELGSLQKQAKDSAEQLQLQRAQMAAQQALNGEQTRYLRCKPRNASHRPRSGGPAPPTGAAADDNRVAAAIQRGSVGRELPVCLGE